LFLVLAVFACGCCCLPSAPDAGVTTTSVTSMPALAGTAITVDEIKTGRALECSFTDAVDNWDWVYKTEYPKVRVEHKTHNGSATEAYIVMGDVEAIDWKGCRPWSEECDEEPEFTEMYLLLKVIPPHLEGQMQPNTWYLTPFFHDFGDFDIVRPEDLVYYIERFELWQKQSEDVSFRCQWLDDIPDSEFVLPPGTVPQKILN